MTIFWPPISTASQLACGGRRLKTRWGRLAIPKTALHRDHSNHGSARTVSKRTSILPGDNLSCRRSGLCGSMPTGSRLANITLSRGELRLTFQDQEIVGWAERSEAHHSPPQRHIRRRQRVRRGRDGSITCNQAHALKSRILFSGRKAPNHQPRACTGRPRKSNPHPPRPARPRRRDPLRTLPFRARRILRKSISEVIQNSRGRVSAAKPNSRTRSSEKLRISARPCLPEMSNSTTQSLSAMFRSRGLILTTMPSFSA